MSISRKQPPDWLRGVTSQTVYQAQENDETLIPAGMAPSSRFNIGPPILHAKVPSIRKRTFLAQALFEIRVFFLDTKLNLLLTAFPFAIISKAVGWGDSPTFILAMVALCPLAERLGFITEQLAMYTNDTLGGLLNASFGNATELIISGFALQHGFVRIVQLSLLGSVVSNLLLVLGTAFLAGGIRNKTQRFNQQGVSVNSALLILGVVAVLLPSLLDATQTGVTQHSSELSLSRGESLLMLILYGCYLLFQLYTHRFLYEEGDDKDKKSDDASHRPTDDVEPPKVLAEPGRTSGRLGSQTLDAAGLPRPLGVDGLPPTAPILQRNGSSRRADGTVVVEMSSHLARGVSADGMNSRASSGRPAPEISVITHTGHHHQENGTRSTHDGLLNDVTPTAGDRTRAASSASDSDSDDQGEELLLSKLGCFIWLAAVTGLIALLSEWIITAIEGASKSLGVPMPFLTTILLPIVGNAAEHASAIVFAYKNRIEIALGVAVGSSTQVAVLIVPFCVVLAWIMGQPLDLDFNSFEACVYFLSVLLAIITMQDGTANWLKGALLLMSYFFIAIGFWMHKDPTLALEDTKA